MPLKKEEELHEFAHLLAKKKRKTLELQIDYVSEKI